jgi:hypothetical protein
VSAFDALAEAYEKLRAAITVGVKGGSMASKEVADLTHLEDWTGVEIHLVRGVVRDGGGNVTNHGNSRRIPFAELAALASTNTARSP